MKYRLIAASFLLANLLTPLGVQACQEWEGNINFIRLNDGGAFSSTAADADARHENTLDSDSDSDFDSGIEEAATPGMLIEVEVTGAWAEAFLSWNEARVFAPVGSSVFVPEHLTDVNQRGKLFLGPAGDAVEVSMCTIGYTEASYATSPGPAVIPGPNNLHATMHAYLQFISFGDDASYLWGTDLNSPPDSMNIDDPYDRLWLNTADDGYIQQIWIDETRLSAMHLGDGVFHTHGHMSTTDETTTNSNGTCVSNFDDTNYGGMNHIYTAPQRILMDSGGTEEVAVFTLSIATTSAGRLRWVSQSLEDPPASGGEGYDEWEWIFTTTAWFQARDFEPTDAEESGGSGGGGGTGTPPGGTGGQGL